MRRYRRLDRAWQFSGSSTRQRDALLAISSGIDADIVDTDGYVASALGLPEYGHVKAQRSHAWGIPSHVRRRQHVTALPRRQECHRRQAAGLIRRTRMMSRRCSRAHSRLPRRQPAASHSPCVAQFARRTRSWTRAAMPERARCSEPAHWVGLVLHSRLVTLHPRPVEHLAIRPRRRDSFSWPEGVDPARTTVLHSAVHLFGARDQSVVPGTGGVRQRDSLV